MSFLALPPEGCLKITAKSRTICVWTNDYGAGQSFVIVAELTTNGQLLNYLVVSQFE